MSWGALGAIAELVGALAVVATLTYLAIQIRTARIGAASATAYAAMEGFSRWRSNIMQNTDIVQALAKANSSEELTQQDHIRLRNLADELFILLAVGATETEKWGPLNRDSIDFEYLRLVFRENPALMNYWERYRPVALAISEEYVSTVDDLITEIKNAT